MSRKNQLDQGTKSIKGMKDSVANLTVQQDEESSNVSTSASTSASTSTTSTKHAKINSDMSQNQGNIDQVREILFGSQLRAQEESLSQLESRLGLEQENLHQKLNDRLDYIESFFKEEMAALKQLITGEIESRSVMEKRVDNAIDQQRLAAEAELKTVNDQLSESITKQITKLDTQISQTITQTTESIENKLDQNETARTASQTKLQEHLSTKLDKTESLFKTTLSEQKTHFDEALTLSTNQNIAAREQVQATLLKDLTDATQRFTELSENLETKLTNTYKELDKKLETTVSEQNTKQMDREILAQHFLDIAEGIKNS